MRALAILGRDAALDVAGAGFIQLDGVTVHAGFVDVPEPAFDPGDPAMAGMVKLRVLGFSCNYRDRALILRMATSSRSRGFYVVGSEFVATVIAVGPGVDDLRPGNRVIPDGAWMDPASPATAAGLAGGLPGNHGSREMQVLPRAKLMRIPPEMDDAVASAFTIGGQTSYAMVRRTGVARGERVLVTAPRSNTTLFALARLRESGAEVHAISTSGRDADALAALGVARLFVADPHVQPLNQDPAIAGEIRRGGGYNVVIDPFCDVYLPHAPMLMAPFGRYVTCGFWDQHTHMTGAGGRPPPVPALAVMARMMMMNLTIMGSCLGTTADLSRAVADHAAGRLSVRLDQVLRGGTAADFLERTYLAEDRFGKVVHLYD